MQILINLETYDLAWILICGFLVASMQAGFTCLESGMVREKNSISVAIKNLIDFCISIFLFSLFGFGLMFGVSQYGVYSNSLFFLSGEMSSGLFAFFFFHAMFCGTATTIVSGAIAERMRFSGYIISSLIIAGLVYPLVGHWVWNGIGSNNFTGWLGAMGFRDFAGSTVVHSVGGWFALAAILVIGPRIGRFGPKGRPIEGNNLSIATLGVFLLWFGWFGFNGGSTLGVTNNLPKIIVNTALGGATGGLAALAITWYLTGKPMVGRIMNGVIAGLVSITASANLISPLMAMLIGAIGGVICILGMMLLEKKEIDDAIGVVPTHLFAGIWGTAAVALAPIGSWGTGLNRMDQFLVQIEGILVVGAYTFFVGYFLLKLVNRWLPLRVSANDERIGLNISEHGARTSVLELITQMDQQARSGDFSERVDVEPETEAAHIAMFYNSVLDGFNSETNRRQMAMTKLAQLANFDTLTGLANRRVYFESIKRALSLSKRNSTFTAVLYMDLDGLKKINDKYGHECGDELLKQVSIRMNKCIRDTDLLARIGGDEFGLLLEDMESKEEIILIANKLIESLAQPISLKNQNVDIGISIGIAQIDPHHKETQASIVKKADHAMYVVKLSGKGTFHFYTEDDELNT